MHRMSFKKTKVILGFKKYLKKNKKIFKKNDFLIFYCFNKKTKKNKYNQNQLGIYVFSNYLFLISTNQNK